MSTTTEDLRCVRRAGFVVWVGGSLLAGRSDRAGDGRVARHRRGDGPCPRPRRCAGGPHRPRRMPTSSGWPATSSTIPLVVVADLRDAGAPDRIARRRARDVRVGRRPRQQRRDRGPARHRRHRRRPRRRDARGQRPCAAVADRGAGAVDGRARAGLDREPVVGIRRRGHAPPGGVRGLEGRAGRRDALPGHRARSVGDPGQLGCPRRRRHRAVGEEQGRPRRGRDDRGPDPTASLVPTRGHRRRDRLPRVRRGALRHR